MVSEPVELAQGIWHPPRSSRAEKARLLADGRHLSIILEGEIAACADGDLSGMTISERIGNVPRRLTFADGSMFETPDNAEIDAFLAKSGVKRSGFIHGLEEFRPRLILFVALTALLVFGIYRYTLPVLVEVAVVVTPPFVPDLLSKGTMHSLDTTIMSASELPLARQKTIQDGFDRLASFSTRGQAGYHLNFRKGGLIGPNAFALPNGTLVITDELITLADGDDEMVFGVLAHEIGHVEHDHSLRQLYRVAGTTGLILLIAGDVGSGVQDILTNGAALLSLSYSRSAESEADRSSVELMMKAGKDPKAIGRFFALIEEKLGDHSETSMLSTHPGTPERKQAIEDYAAELKKSANNPQ